jgi:Cu+-exporting ATPase
VNATGRASAGAATIENGVQKVAVQVGFTYTPDVIRLKAGMPAEITFGEGQGCTAVVQSEVLGFQEDLTTGPRTVKLQGLAPGSYEFACGMNMVRGQIVVS